MAEAQYGSTGPRLAFNLRHHNPAQLVHSRRAGQPTSAWGNQATEPVNFLLRLPPGYNSNDDQPRTKPMGACTHSFSTKIVQTHVQYPPEPLERGEKWQYSAICQNCRWHLKATMERKEATHLEGQPCPKTGFPLHHLVLEAHETVEAEVLDKGAERYRYRCTSCPISFEAYYYPPRLNEAWISLLTSSHNLQKRYEEFRLSEPDRDNPRPEKAISVLEALSAYIRDGLKPSDQKKKIPRANRRLKLSFGSDCTDFLKWLGFEIDGEHWVLPHPPVSDIFGPYNQRRLLEDAREELLARLRDWPEHERQQLKNVTQAEWAPIFDDRLEVVLGAAIYDRKASLRNPARLTPSEENCYEALGAIWDLSDELLLFAFDKQITCDQPHAVYYYDCLIELAQIRKTEALQLAIATMASKGLVSSQDIDNAYRYFAMDPKDASNLIDDTILGQFQSRLADSAPGMESELRQQLRILGQARHSELLTNAANNDIQTAQQAIHWLDPRMGDVQPDDEAILAMATSKAADDPSSVAQVRRAVQILQQDRHSPFLQDWLNNSSGNYNIDTIDPREEELAAAYRFFEVNDRTADVDLSVLDTHVQSILFDRPDEEEKARKYFDIIKEHQENRHKPTVSIQVPNYESPVGLVNMGNTCYLNCLLQYFYTIAPFRDTVLNLDQYKMDTAFGTYQPKKVLNMSISRTDAERAQDFVQELKILFTEMAHAPGPSINPTWKLASQALSTQQSAGIPRRSTISSDRPFFGPLREDSTLALDTAGMTAIEEEDRAGTPDSTKPLIGTPKDELSDDTLHEFRVATPPESPPPALIEIDEPSYDIPAPVHHRRSDSGVDTEPMQGIMDVGHTEPKRPPPIPPRPKAPKREETWRQEAEAAALQQDVTEVIDNVLFKIMCAIKPEGTDTSGGQIDHIKDLFFGNYLWSYIDDKVEDREEQFMSIEVNLNSKPKDIYAGLDTFFDSSEIELDGRTIERHASLTAVPPMFSVAIARQGYDPIKGAYVLKHHMALEDTLYLDRYLAKGPSDLQARRKASQRDRKELHDLESKRAVAYDNDIGLDNGQTMDALVQFVAEMVDNDAAQDSFADETDAIVLSQDMRKLGSELQVRSKYFKDTNTDIDAKIATQTSVVASQFSDLREHPYNLAAVFMHRGAGGSKGGHYWIYIRDFKLDIWRRYEDREVSTVSADEIFHEADPETVGAPYLVIYVDGKKTDLIDALQRSAPPAVAVDDEATMSDAPSSQILMKDTQMADMSMTVDSSDTIKGNGARSAKEQYLMDTGQEMDLDGAN